MKNKYIKTLFSLFILFLFFIPNAHSQLSTGDIAFIGLNTDATEGYAIITLTDIPGSEKIFFTDRGVINSASWIPGTEGTYLFTAPIAGISCGTIIRFHESPSDTYAITGVTGATMVLQSGSANLGSGDQVLAYQTADGLVATTPGGATFIAGIHSDYDASTINPTTKWTTSADVSSTSESALPPGLTNGTNAISLTPSGPEKDNFRYTGTLTGTSTFIRAQINDFTNWETNDGPPYDISPTGYAAPSVTCVAAATTPTVTTTAASSISGTSATLAGNVTSDGGETVTERGIVYSVTSTNENPLIGGTGVTKDTNGTGTGIFSESISSFSLSTNYSFKAYAINSEGTSYGAVQTFTTLANDTNTYTAASGNWSTGGDWSLGRIPISTDNIIIPAAKSLTLDIANAEVNDLTIDATGIFIIQSDKSLTIENNLSNSGSFTINSGGSLIISGTSSGNITYNRNLPTSNWYLVASPFNGETIEDYRTNNSLALGSGSNVGFAEYTNNGSAWSYKTTSSTGAITSGKGYSTKLSATGNITYTGTMQTSSVDIGITDGTDNEFNLIGNPYPSYIPVNTNADATNNILTNNSLQLSENTIWFWDQASDSYVTINQASPSRYIAPGQGFFVNSKASGGTFSFTEAMQSHQAIDVFNKGKKQIFKIQLVASNNTVSKSTEIYFINGTTSGFDNGYDSSLFIDSNNDFSIYSNIVLNNNDKRLAIQSLPDSNYESTIIPIGLNALAGEEITFSIDAENKPNGLKLYLEDRKEKKFTRLDEENSSYKITLNSDSNSSDRFYLHINSSVLIIEDTKLKKVTIYKTTNTNLRVSGLQNNNVTLSMFNLIGKKVFIKSFKSETIKDISIPKLTSGIYIIQVKTEQGIFSKKIIIE